MTLREDEILSGAKKNFTHRIFNCKFLIKSSISKWDFSLAFMEVNLVEFRLVVNIFI